MLHLSATCKKAVSVLKYQVQEIGADIKGSGDYDEVALKRDLEDRLNAHMAVGMEELLRVCHAHCPDRWQAF